MQIPFTIWHFQKFLHSLRNAELVHKIEELNNLEQIFVVE